MLRMLKGDLRGYQIEATDGVIGHMTDVYFDDDQWTVRYFVVKTGGWLDAREVLLSPSAVERAEWDTRTLVTGLTKKQVENSPSIDLDQPVSRQCEERSVDYYGWPAYWAPQPLADDRVRPEHPDPHLRSTRELIDYHLHAVDGTLGHVEDFIIDEETWELRYMAVDTAIWWHGAHVLISPQWIASVNWSDQSIQVRVTRDIVKHSPTWKPSYLISERYVATLHDYYRRRLAWASDPRSNESPLEPVGKTP